MFWSIKNQVVPQALLSGSDLPWQSTLLCSGLSNFSVFLSCVQFYTVRNMFAFSGGVPLPVWDEYS